MRKIFNENHPSLIQQGASPRPFAVEIDRTEPLTGCRLKEFKMLMKTNPALAAEVGQERAAFLGIKDADVAGPYDLTR